MSIMIKGWNYAGEKVPARYILELQEESFKQYGSYSKVLACLWHLSLS